MPRGNRALKATIGVVVFSSTILVAALVVASCLPDLGTSLCGNGHIDSTETCDPGPNPNPGCSANCQIVCANASNDAAAFTSYFLDYPASNHCYFASSGVTNYNVGVEACRYAESHPVTFVDDNEVSNVLRAFGGSWLATSGQYWVGMESTDAGGPYYALSLNEPGWNVPALCPGCFMHGVTDGGLPVLDGGAFAGPAECVVASDTPQSSAMATTGHGAVAQVVCEREPVGARSVPCYADSFCFNVLATQATTSQTSKGYVFNPTRMRASEAARFCEGLTDGGATKLVVFESRAEREQVIYELSQLRGLPGGESVFPVPFWISLHARAVPADAGSDAGGPAAGPVEWVWGDGVPASRTSTGPRPAIWASGEPDPMAVGYAFIDNEGTFDTGLARARAGNMQTAAVMCQY
jgi:hypothetical protein